MNGDRVSEPESELPLPRFFESTLVPEFSMVDESPVGIVNSRLFSLSPVDPESLEFSIELAASDDPSSPDRLLPIEPMGGDSRELIPRDFAKDEPASPRELVADDDPAIDVSSTADFSNGSTLHVLESLVGNLSLPIKLDGIRSSR